VTLNTHLLRVLSGFSRREPGDLLRIGLLAEREGGGDLARLGDSLRTRGGGDSGGVRVRRNGDAR